MSIHSEIRLHEALRHAHGLPHHVKQWLAQPSNKLMTRHAAPPRPVPQPAPAPTAERSA